MQCSYQIGYTQLLAAKKAPRPTVLDRYAVYVREQEHTQKSSMATTGDAGQVDLTSYVEFQRNYRLTVRMHMDALLARRGFWETLISNRVTFDKLSNAVDRIEWTVRAAERM